jgi:hypothetical protein
MCEVEWDILRTTIMILQKERNGMERNNLGSCGK